MELAHPPATTGRSRAGAWTHTPQSGVDDRDTFVRGTLLGAAGVASAVVVGLAAWSRWAWAFGFAVGALISLGNFHLIAHAVGGAMGLGGSRATTTLWKGALFRFGISGVALVVALLLLRTSLAALVAGLLITQVTMVVLWLIRASRSAA